VGVPGKTETKETALSSAESGASSVTGGTSAQFKLTFDDVYVFAGKLWDGSFTESEKEKAGITGETLLPDPYLLWELDGVARYVKSRPAVPVFVSAEDKYSLAQGRVVWRGGYDYTLEYTSYGKTPMTFKPYKTEAELEKDELSYAKTERYETVKDSAARDVKLSFENTPFGEAEVCTYVMPTGYESEENRRSVYLEFERGGKKITAVKLFANGDLTESYIFIREKRGFFGIKTARLELSWEEIASVGVRRLWGYDPAFIEFDSVSEFEKKLKSGDFERGEKKSLEYFKQAGFTGEPEALELQTNGTFESKYGLKQIAAVWYGGDDYAVFYGKVTGKPVWSVMPVKTEEALEKRERAFFEEHALFETLSNTPGVTNVSRTSKQSELGEMDVITFDTDTEKGAGIGYVEYSDGKRRTVVYIGFAGSVPTETRAFVFDGACSFEATFEYVALEDIPLFALTPPASE